MYLATKLTFGQLNYSVAAVREPAKRISLKVQTFVEISLVNFKNNPSIEVFLKKGILKICSKFTGEHPCAEVLFQQSCEVTLLKSRFGMGVLP